MYAVSKQYKELMNRPIRNRGHMIVTIGVINKEAQAGADIISDAMPWASKHCLYSNRPISGRYATMEQNCFKCDGSMNFLPQSLYPVYFLVNEYCTKELLGIARISFNNIYSLKGLTIDFGEIYPTEFTITTDEYSYTYTNDKSLFTTTDSLGDTKSLVITPITMVGGQQRLRINKLTMGVGLNYTNKDIISSSIRESVSSVSEELPSMDFQLTIADEDNVYNVDDDNSFINFLETGQNVSVVIGLEDDNGDIEYVEMLNAPLTDWQSQNGRMQFSACGKLAFMDEIYPNCNRIYGRTLYEEAESVLQYYGFQPDDYIIDECLWDIWVTNPLPEVSGAQCLQLIANAGRCILYQNRKGQICLRANFANVIDPDDMTITANEEATWSNVENVLTGSDYVCADMTQNFFSADGSMIFMNADNTTTKNTGFVSKTISDENGEFETNPKITLSIPAGHFYYGVYVNFDGNPPLELKVRTYYNGDLQNEVTYTDLQKNNILNYEFKIFDTMEFEVTKTVPYNRVLINKITFGDMTDYTLTRKNMLEKPIGYREKKVKEVKVRIFTINLVDGVVVQTEDMVYSTQSVNPTGSVVTFENQLISTEEHAQMVAEWLGNYYANNVSYNVKYRGEPRLNASDIIKMESDVLNNLQVEISNHQLDFNGAFSGQLELRRALRMMGV